MCRVNTFWVRSLLHSATDYRERFFLILKSELSKMFQNLFCIFAATDEANLGGVEIVQRLKLCVMKVLFYLSQLIT